MNMSRAPLLLLLALAACDRGAAPAATPAPATAPAPAAPPAAATAASAPTRTPSPIAGAAARALVASGAPLLDVRSPGEFAAGHIAGARNVPIDELPKALASLPRDKPVIVYCAAGVRAARAASLLGAAGFDARNLGAMARWDD